MKNLSTIINEKINQLLKKYNGFFAFSEKQFEEAKKENVKYVCWGAGLYLEAGKSEEFDEDFKSIIKEAIEQDLKENGKEAIIERELENYECYYTNDISNAVIHLKDYDITYDEIKAVFNKNKQ